MKSVAVLVLLLCFAVLADDESRALAFFHARLRIRFLLPGKKQIPNRGIGRIRALPLGHLE
ncbi:MAG: hypothetical protein ACKOEI_09820, partial [Chthoniobacterales bacterium]